MVRVDRDFQHLANRPLASQCFPERQVVLWRSDRFQGRSTASI